MAFNGSGTFTRLYSWAQDKINSIKIRADRMDAEMDGFATGLSNVICRDGQSTVTDNIPMNSNKITGLAAAASNGDAVRWEQISDSLAAEASIASATTCNILGAASERIVITGTTTITSLGTGTNRVRFVRFTGALTLTHNATSLILPGGADITTADGDTMIVVSDASSNARVVAKSKVNNGDWSGTDLAIANGGTGASDEVSAVNNLIDGLQANTGLGVAADDTFIINNVSAGGAREITAADLIQGLLGLLASGSGAGSDNIIFSDSGTWKVDAYEDF